MRAVVVDIGYQQLRYVDPDHGPDASRLSKPRADIAAAHLSFGSAQVWRLHGVFFFLLALRDLTR